MPQRATLTGIAIGIASLLFLLVGIGRPSTPIFDESLYVNGARSFLNGVSTGAQDANPEHPPLAKIFIAGAMKIAGDNPLGWRLAGAVCGALTVVAIFFWTNMLLGDCALALTAALLTLLNNLLFVMARVAMLDVFYFAFVMWAVLAFTAAIVLDVSIFHRRLLLFSSGLLFGLGTACKWNAVVTLAGAALVAAILYLKNTNHLREIGIPAIVLALMMVPPAAYTLAFWPLCRRFHLLFTPREWLALNAYIWRYHLACPGNPALDTRWYQWIFRATPERGLNYLMGNWVVVWGGFLALLLCAWNFLRTRYLPEGLVVLFYAVNLLQWVLIPQQRTVYYYYYPPAMFLGVAMVVVLSRMRWKRICGVRIELLLLLAAAAFFLYCYPRMAALEAPYDCMLGCWS
jgi:predicted membrane-bound dolichyl-phosphate-mannose-protein mannosyltransferase